MLILISSIISIYDDFAEEASSQPALCFQLLLVMPYVRCVIALSVGTVLQEVELVSIPEGVTAPSSPYLTGYDTCLGTFLGPNDIR